MHNSLLFTARSIDRSLIHFLLCPIVPENYVAQIQLRINASFLSPIVSTFSTIFLRHVWIRRVALLLRIHWPFDKPFVPPFSSEITALFPFLNGFCTTGSFEIVETGNCFSFQVQCSVNYVLWFLGRIEFNYDFEYRPRTIYRCKKQDEDPQGMEFKCNPLYITHLSFCKQHNPLLQNIFKQFIQTSYREINCD